MSIRQLAMELYRVMKRIEELERDLERPDLRASEREQRERELTEAKAERNRIKAMLEGAKEK